MKADLSTGLLLAMFAILMAHATLATEVFSGDPAPASSGEKGEPQPLPSFTVGEKTFERVSLVAVKGRVVTISHAFGVKDLSLDLLTTEQIEELNKTSAKVKIEPTSHDLPGAAAAAGSTNAPPAISAPTAPPANLENPFLDHERMEKIRSIVEDYRKEAQRCRAEAEALKAKGADPAAINEYLNKANTAEQNMAEVQKDIAKIEEEARRAAENAAAAAKLEEAARAVPTVERPAEFDGAKIMAEQFQSLAGPVNGASDSEYEDQNVQVPWYVRLSAWAGFFMGGFGALWLCGAAIHNNDSLTWALLIFFLGPLAATVYFILNFRNVWIPYVCYIVGFFMLAIPKFVYGMSFFQLLM